MDKTAGGIIGLTILVMVIIFSVVFSQDKKLQSIPLNERCVEHSGLAMHIHPVVTISLDGQPVAIPANIGISADCMRTVHTHDETGTLHIESPTEETFMLKHFFANWGQAFNKDELMDKKVNDGYTITITVDGAENSEFENLVLKDKQKIEIKAEKK
jgi:hypothetical protein